MSKIEEIIEEIKTETTYKLPGSEYHGKSELKSKETETKIKTETDYDFFELRVNACKAGLIIFEEKLIIKPIDEKTIEQRKSSFNTLKEVLEDLKEIETRCYPDKPSII